MCTVASPAAVDKGQRSVELNDHIRMARRFWVSSVALMLMAPSVWPGPGDHAGAIITVK